MLRKGLILLFALVLLIGSHLHRSCDMELNGQIVSAGCSPAAVDRAVELARLTAEEILPGPVTLPECVRHVYLGFTPGTESCPELTDALLRSTPGISVSSAVYVGDARLGCVSDGEAFIGKLKSYILNTMPSWAVHGSISQELYIVPQYGRSTVLFTNDDMIQLVTGKAPVLFSDGKEHISTV